MSKLDVVQIQGKRVRDGGLGMHAEGRTCHKRFSTVGVPVYALAFAVAFMLCLLHVLAVLLIQKND